MGRPRRGSGRGAHLRSGRPADRREGAPEPRCSPISPSTRQAADIWAVVPPWRGSRQTGIRWRESSAISSFYPSFILENRTSKSRHTLVLATRVENGGVQIERFADPENGSDHV